MSRHSLQRVGAVGVAAAVVTLAVGAVFTASASDTASAFVPIEPVRVLDTRIDVGLTGPLTSDEPRRLPVTGDIPVVGSGNVPSQAAPVPPGAVGIVANVTAVDPSTIGYVSVRPGTATGQPTTSNLNITEPGTVVPNSVTVELPTGGDAAGAIDLWFHGTQADATTHLLVDVVGYYLPSAGPAEPLRVYAGSGRPAGDGALAVGTPMTEVTTFVLPAARWVVDVTVDVVTSGPSGGGTTAVACRLDVGGEVDEHIVHLVPDTTQQIAAAVDLQAVYTYDVAAPKSASSATGRAGKRSAGPG